MDIRLEPFFAIDAEDQPGLLARVTATLLEAEVDMEGMWGFGKSAGSAEIIAVPRDVPRFKNVAADAGWKLREGSCFRIDGVDKIGALVDILNRIASEGINLQWVDAMAVGDRFGCYLWGDEKDVITIGQLLGVRSLLV